jgi:hypothetical protein
MTKQLWLGLLKRLPRQIGHNREIAILNVDDPPLSHPRVDGVQDSFRLHG